MSEQLIQTPGVFGDNGNFLLERELGAGGMGGVYMGRDKMLDRPIAVKVMLPEFGSDPEFVDKFKKEAQAAARLIHPNIVQVYSYGIFNGMPYMALELASGGSLWGLMKANPGKTDIQRVLKICQQTAQALQCATDQGFVHGDVKPENILLDANGNAKLVDFGLAAMQKDTNEIWGTPYYISPEKVKKEPIDFRADMYSLGGTLYHALTGVSPFEGDDAIAVVKKRFEGVPKKPSEIRADITPAVDKLVMTMLAFKKEDRYPSFEALIDAFKETLTSGLTQKIPTKPDEAKPASSPAGTKKMSVKTRRVSMLKKKTSASSPADKPEGDEVESAKPAVEEEEEGANIGKKVAISVGIGVAVIGVLVGGFFWYVDSKKKSEAREAQANLVAGCKEMRSAISSFREQVQDFLEGEKKKSDSAIEACTKFTKDFQELLPEYANKLKPEPTPELLEAQAHLSGEANPSVAPTNAPAATATTPAETAEDVRQIPNEVFTIRELWERAYGCQAAYIRISVLGMQIIAKCDEAALLTNDTADVAANLDAINKSVSELFGQLKGSKDVEKLDKGIRHINETGNRTIADTKRNLRIKRDQEEREAKAAMQEAAEKKRKEELEAKRKALVEQETNSVRAKFSALASQGASGCFGQLDWGTAERQLKQVSSEFKTEEGRQATKFELKKVEQMKLVHDTLVKKAKGYTFTKGKLRGFTIIKADVNGIEVRNAKDRKSQKVFWPKFYKDYAGNFDELIRKYIENGRKESGLTMNEWKDAMVGAAMTLRLVCTDNDGAQKKAVVMAQQIVKVEPEFADLMKQIFPDISFEGLNED